MQRLISIAFLIALAVVAGCAHMEAGGSDPVVMAEAMVPSDPGVSVYVRNKRLASMTTFTAAKTVLFVHGATYPVGDAFDLKLGGMSWMDYIASPATTSGCSTCAATAARRGRQRWTSRRRRTRRSRTPKTRCATWRGGRLHPAGARRSRLNLIGWSWGTVIMALVHTRNNAKVHRLVLYAPVWMPADARRSIRPGPARSALIAPCTMSAARARWLAGVAPEKQKDLDARRLVRSWADATLESDPGGMARNPPVLRAPNGVRARRPRYWAAPGGQAKMPYSAADIRVPTLLVKAEWDVDTPAYMAQTLFPLLTNAPSSAHVEIGEGTHTVMLEQNRMRLFREVQLFLDERYAPGK